jgi:hypothetical protein
MEKCSVNQLKLKPSRSQHRTRICRPPGLGTLAGAYDDHEEMIERVMDCTCGWKWNNGIKCKLVSNAEFTITAMLGNANSTM